ncbi:Type II secretion system protein E [Methanocaldococcus lauensis]|uniref:Type II secretion system protein E n=1 Tax=Methanocaldococcus lauensis TaxID=2546128 RepID=A0A8D6PUW9_9EURY|nr:type II/IV secretion system ATPase subunit [Methanocaldococcus lauensis]CAB3289155.1 Type II secretion system protein E [Methanocaldococcus lauensis]
MKKYGLKLTSEDSKDKNKRIIDNLKKVLKFFNKSLKKDTKDNILHEDTLKEVYEEIKNLEIYEKMTIDMTNVIIGYDKIEKMGKYIVIEPILTKDEEELFLKLKKAVQILLDIPIEEIEKEKLEEYLRERILEIFNDLKLTLDNITKHKIIYYLIKYLTGYGKIDVLMKDENLEDISCTGVGKPVYVFHRKYRHLKTNIKFETEEELDSFCISLAQRCGKSLTLANPIVDGSLPDGSRLNVTLGKDISRYGSTFTIRKFTHSPILPTDLIRYGSISPDMLAYLWLLIEYKNSIMVAGEVATGKTTLLNAFSLFIPPEMKIVSIEDTPEIKLFHENWIAGTTRGGFGGKEYEITMMDLLKAALRQRPDYLIVGEVRGEEAKILFQAITTGHLALSTIHAKSPEAVIRRLNAEPMNIPKIMLEQLNAICMQVRLIYKGKFVRKTKSITEIVEYNPKIDDVILHDVFWWNPKEDTFEFSGKSYLLKRIAEFVGSSEKDIIDELYKRAEFLKNLSKTKLSFEEFVKNICKYREDYKGD